MKCQQCDKPATFHITELTGGEPQELHYCEECAREYLSQPDTESEESKSLAGALAQQLKIGQTAEELARLDQQSCPICGITFYEFRNQGRLGCPHDYECFADELDPLISNIHGANEHTGKRPSRLPKDSKARTELIRLRRQMKEAVDHEDYETASKLRDKIRELEKSESPQTEQ
ncbi:MAG: UvrB/UvrC motif-containing protein [Pirellulaceae bacterium]|nr:UvrB/UvrC motif-containing protein [Planctomycetales bacterium]